VKKELARWSRVVRPRHQGGLSRAEFTDHSEKKTNEPHRRPGRAYRIWPSTASSTPYGHVSGRSERDPKRYLWRARLRRSLSRPRTSWSTIWTATRSSAGTGVVRERFIHGEIFQAAPGCERGRAQSFPSVVPSASRRSRCGPLFPHAAFVGEGLPNSKSAMPREAPTCSSRRPIWAGAGKRWRLPGALMRGMLCDVGESVHAPSDAASTSKRARNAAPGDHDRGPRGKITYLDDQESSRFRPEPGLQARLADVRAKRLPASTAA